MRLLRFARNDGISGILDGILNEIAPSALLPRNDGILYGILEFLEFCYNYKQIYKPRLKNAYKSCSS